MAIITGKEILRPYLKKTTGYIKSLLSAQHVEMDDGQSLQTAVDEINNNLTYEFGALTMNGAPKGCNATISGNSWYMRLGKMISFCTEISLERNGSNLNEQIRIPCLPYPPMFHSTFSTGYQTAVIKGNGEPSEIYTVTKAGAYGNANEIYLLESNGARMWNVNQGELMSNGVILISGFYFIK